MTVPDQAIQPPPPRWRTPALVAGVALLVVALVAGVLTVIQVVRSCGDGVTKRGEHGECIGVTDGAAVFAPELAAIQEQIHQENLRVVESEKPYVSVAVLLPMTVTEDDIVTWEWVKHQLQGAHLAQARANHTEALGARTPQIRLLLANPGSRFAQWQPVLEELQSRRQSEHLVAVTGVGLSLSAARDAMRRLSELDMPIIGSTLPTDDVGDLRGFLRVSPTNSAQARAAASYLKRRGARTATLVQDINQGDLYPRTLARTFSEHFSDDEHRFVGRTERYDSSLPGVGNTFLQMVPNICNSRPDAIYFAGRANHLPAFIEQLTSRGCREDLPITVVTADDVANVDMPNEILRRARQADVTVIHTALAHPGAWTAEPERFGAATASFVETSCATCFTTLFPDEPDDALDDGVVILSHDSVLTAVWAARSTGVSEVTPQDILQVMNRLHGMQSVPGAGGRLEFDERGNPIHKALPILQLVPDGRSAFLSLAPGGR